MQSRVLFVYLVVALGRLGVFGQGREAREVPRLRSE
jgi:hypothetical protein